MATGKVTAEDVRMFMMDKPELNPLLRSVRWSQEEIDKALIMSVSYYNETPPLVGGYSIETFPYRYTLLTGAAGYLLKSAAINEASNQLTYSAAEVTVDDKNKAEIFSRMGADFWAEFKDKVLNIKAAQNIAACFGSETSELIYVAR